MRKQLVLRLWQLNRHILDNLKDEKPSFLTRHLTFENGHVYHWVLLSQHPSQHMMADIISYRLLKRSCILIRDLIVLCICTIYVYVCSCVTKERRCIRQRESSQAFTFIYLFDTNFITMHAYICLWSLYSKVLVSLLLVWLQIQS